MHLFNALPNAVKDKKNTAPNFSTNIIEANSEAISLQERIGRAGPRWSFLVRRTISCFHQHLSSYGSFGQAFCRKIHCASSHRLASESASPMFVEKLGAVFFLSFTAFERALNKYMKNNHVVFALIETPQLLCFTNGRTKTLQAVCNANGNSRNPKKLPISFLDRCKIGLRYIDH
ncbi:hypothetical protein T265_12121 [Opisthorchis viverrini]|uniref:Uncharacterized protein n=1 Tax=Opisthorchis viverrini TaxID=6198 RepID=A0A074Z6J2_OPIVI|nr:hypothetical protein T265_12121 [Opisthorchis viverrini]KER18870.1 hypothetical protein T265_12121 [Opisthorchis viverrini]